MIKFVRCELTGISKLHSYDNLLKRNIYLMKLFH